MKKYLLSVILTMVVALCYAQEITQEGRAFRTDIQQFLREEGFSPYIDNNESLCFKKDGSLYWIDFIDDKPIYVPFSREIFKPDNIDQMAAIKAANEVSTKIRAVKCCYIDDKNNGGYITLSIESYCHVSEEFKYVFYTYLYILDAAREEVVKIYNNLIGRNSLSYSTSRSTYSSNSNQTTIGEVIGRNGNRVSINAPICRTEYHSWWLTSVELNSYNTIVNVTVVPKTNSSWICSTKDEYIEDCDTGKRYYITSSSIGISPNKTTLYSKDPKTFSNTFPALPNTVKRISVWSGDDYYIRNLKIR